MATVTDTMIKQRAAKSAAVKPGQWHADFSTVKKYADSKGIPLLAVWSNGDACGHCIHFEQCVQHSTFKNWAKTSGVAMWIGFGKDTSKEDKFEGTGFTFARKGTLRMYPFVRLYWKKGKVDVCKTGDDWTGANTKAADGAAKIVKLLKSYLKSYTPATTTTTTAATTTTTTTTTPEKDPVLGYKKGDCCEGYVLTVDGEECISEELAKKVCDIYKK